MSYSKQDLECKNKNIDNMEDLPEEKVERKDGLPTTDDLEELMGKKKPESSKEDSLDRKADDLGEYIEKIIAAGYKITLDKS
jgi:hypothetical protein